MAASDAGIDRRHVAAMAAEQTTGDLLDTWAFFRDEFELEAQNVLAAELARCGVAVDEPTLTAYRARRPERGLDHPRGVHRALPLLRKARPERPDRPVLLAPADPDLVDDDPLLRRARSRGLATDVADRAVAVESSLGRTLRARASGGRRRRA